MLRKHRPIFIVALIVIVGNLIGFNSAFALFGVGDTSDGILASMLAQGAEALTTANSSLSSINEINAFGKKAFQTAKDTYNLTKHSAQLADDAVQTTAAMKNFSAARFGTEFTQDMEMAFPDVAYVRREANNPLGLKDHYGGAISQALRYCLADAVNSQYKDACTHLKGKTEEERLQGMSALAFTTSPSNATTAPATRHQLQTRIIEEQIKETLKQIDADDNARSKAAAKLADLRQECLKRNPSSTTKRTYGVFQDIADDLGRVSNDLSGFSGDSTNSSPVATANTGNVDLQNITNCADLSQHATIVSAEMQEYSQKVRDAKDRLDTLWIQLQTARIAEQDQAASDQHKLIASSPLELDDRKIRFQTKQ